jgi:metal-responsive CopG/Arc/MetJ family transcriptional regulator
MGRYDGMSPQQRLKAQGGQRKTVDLSHEAMVALDYIASKTGVTSRSLIIRQLILSEAKRLGKINDTLKI